MPPDFHNLQILKMRKSLVFFFILLSIACIANNNPPDINNKVVKKDTSNIIDPPFGITLQIEKIENDQYNLIVDIELKNKSYIISPFSKDEVYGHFNISIEGNSKLTPIESLLETPKAVEEFDPILNEPVKFVRVNTTYKQKVKLLEKDNFEMSGLIWFVLEPSCIPYDVNFVISNRSGVMKIHKTKTSISKGYKQ